MQANCLFTIAAVADVGQALVLMVVGMLVVFISLLLLLSVVELINWLWRAELPPPPRPAKSPAAPPPVRSASPRQPEISPQLLAVLTAAATATLQQSVRVARVRFVGQQKNALWAQMGRRSIMSSHHLRRSR